MESQHHQPDIFVQPKYTPNSALDVRQSSRQGPKNYEPRHDDTGGVDPGVFDPGGIFSGSERTVTGAASGLASSAMGIDSGLALIPVPVPRVIAVPVPHGR